MPSSPAYNWRGPAEQAYYREMQRTARSYGFRSWNGYDE